VRHFFRYAQNAGMITENPAARLSAIKITDDDFEVDTPSISELACFGLHLCA
jgi:hypothetical protein